MGDLFRQSAKYVAEHLDFQYSYEDDQRVTAYLKLVESLSPNVTEIY